MKYVKTINARERERERENDLSDAPEFTGANSMTEL